ncbi:hypothetical protein LY78DRAFT_650703 [Colletotrichum sublineola]|nr:hypothetical protein LY78DRAFT_650703 [Colletotrichum sublineola]
MPSISLYPRPVGDGGSSGYRRPRVFFVAAAANADWAEPRIRPRQRQHRQRRRVRQGPWAREKNGSSSRRRRARWPLSLSNRLISPSLKASTQVILSRCERASLRCLPRSSSRRLPPIKAIEKGCPGHSTPAPPSSSSFARKMNDEETRCRPPSNI